MKFLLSVIAVCLVMITAKLYIPEVNANVSGLDASELQTDIDITSAVRFLVKSDAVIEEAIEDIVEGCLVESGGQIYCY